LTGHDCAWFYKLWTKFGVDRACLFLMSRLLQYSTVDSCRVHPSLKAYTLWGTKVLTAVYLILQTSHCIWGLQDFTIPKFKFLYCIFLERMRRLLQTCFRRKCAPKIQWKTSAIHSLNVVVTFLQQAGRYRCTRTALRWTGWSTFENVNLHSGFAWLEARWHCSVLWLAVFMVCVNSSRKMHHDLIHSNTFLLIINHTKFRCHTILSNWQCRKMNHKKQNTSYSLQSPKIAGNVHQFADREEE